MNEVKQGDILEEKRVRLQRLQELQDAGINPYPAKTTRTHTVEQALVCKEGESVAVAGRIMTKREMGKLTFCHLQDFTGKMQIAFKQDDLGADNYKLFIKKIDLSDIIEVKGERFVTHKGEQSILVKEWKLLSKSLLPLPDKFHGLQDEEIRYRKRYLDFLVNTDQKEKIIIRAKVMKALREFLNKHDFVEVETPMLESIASGAMAKTFDTKLNAYNLAVHLRICAGELWQKRLLVGGFEKTFDMGRAFRNEGVDREHNPEFTMLEYYWAFADINDNIKFHEQLIPFVVKEAIGKLEVLVDGHNINFAPPYPAITFHDAVLEYSNIDINNFTDVKSLAEEMKKKGYSPEGITERGKLIDELYKQSTRPKIIQPTFVLNYPIELKPLAKKSSDPRYTEMFQLIVNGFELSNSYTELNDPVDQRARFAEQVKNKEEGDEEAMNNDWDYVEALEHGMPPATGTGIGIDRFTALITGSHTLREVTAFPLMKPLEQDVQSTTNNINQKYTDNLLPLPMDREQAWQLILKYNNKEANLNHYLESEAIMRALAKKLNKDINYWGMLGLLHDIDWELTENDATKHLTLAPKLLKDAGFADDFIEIVLSHGYGFNCANLQDKKRSREVEYALSCAETTTGLVYAAARMRPDKIASLELSSLKKKFKDKKFAAGCNRDIILECEKMGISIDEFLQLAIDALKEIAPQIGLA